MSEHWKGLDARHAGYDAFETGQECPVNPGNQWYEAWWDGFNAARIGRPRTPENDQDQRTEGAKS